MYWALGICLTLACLLIVNLLVAIAASSVLRLFSPYFRQMSADRRARLIFGLGVLPVTAAVISACGYVLPSYLIHEPAVSGEVVSGKLAFLAFMSCAGVLFATFRVIRTFASTRRLVSNWLSNATKIGDGENGVPIYLIEHEFPVIALIGILRPRIFVAAKVLDSLTEAEIDAAIAHEYEHLSASDNLRRALLGVCRDLLIVPIGSGLEREWARIAEQAADERAATTGQTSALDLAGALVKIARIAPANAYPAMPSGAFLIDRDEVDVTSRVKSLLAIRPGATVDQQLAISRSTWSCVCILTAVLMLPLTSQSFYAYSHHAIERVVHLLR